MQQMNEDMEWIILMASWWAEFGKEKSGEKSSGGWQELGVMAGGSHRVEGYENKGY